MSHGVFILDQSSNPLPQTRSVRDQPVAEAAKHTGKRSTSQALFYYTKKVRSLSVFPSLALNAPQSALLPPGNLHSNFAPPRYNHDSVPFNLILFTCDVSLGAFPLCLFANIWAVIAPLPDFPAFSSRRPGKWKDKESGSPGP